MSHASVPPARRTSSRRTRTTTTVAVVMPLLLLLLECLSLTTTCDASATVGSRVRVARAAVAAAAVSAGKDTIGGGNSPLNGASSLLVHSPVNGNGGNNLIPKLHPKKARVPYFVGHLFADHPHHHHADAAAARHPQHHYSSHSRLLQERPPLFPSTNGRPLHSEGAAEEELKESLGGGSTLSPAFTENDKDVDAQTAGQVVAAGCRRPSVAIENSECNYDAVEEINQDLTRQLKGIVSQKFFKYYKLNLYGTCPFWTENHYCTNEDCSVALIDEKHIPEEWRSKALGAISSPRSGMLFQPYKACNLKDQDFCQVNDEANSEGVYVDLMENPERFTGYSGPSAAKVWGAIYNENCFNVAHRMQLAADCEQCQLDRELEAQKAAEEQIKQQVQASSGGGLSSRPAGMNGMAHVFGNTALAAGGGGAGSPPAPAPFFLPGPANQDDEDMCLEKRVFYRMISGLHASISIHICDEYFNQTTGVWGPNLECFVSRVGAHPDRMENLFFDYSMLLRAVSKMSRYLKDYSFCTGNAEEDKQVKGMVDKFIETAKRAPARFDEKAMFVGPAAQQLKTEFRDHYRNITRIMDCVGCEKCRLWGKVQTSGLATALKVLFSYNDEFFFSSSPVNHPDLLQRTEIVALFNTLNRFSESIESIARFRRLYLEEYGYPEPTYWTPSPTSSPDIETEASVDEQDSLEEETALEAAMLDHVVPQSAALQEEGVNVGAGAEQVEFVQEPMVKDMLLLENDSQQIVAEQMSDIDRAAIVNPSDDVQIEQDVSSFLSQFLQQVSEPIDDPILTEALSGAVKQKLDTVLDDKPQQSSVVSSMVLYLREKVLLRFYNTRSWLASLFENRYNGAERMNKVSEAK